MSTEMEPILNPTTGCSPTPADTGTVAGTDAGAGSPDANPTIEVRLAPDFFDRSIRADVGRGLTSTPKELPPKWFYDDRGSELFDRITRLPEYYPTRREWEILRREAGHIADFGAEIFIELGSGTSEKTRTLLDAMVGSGLRTYVPFDVSEGMLSRQARSLVDEYPDLRVHAMVADFEHHMGTWPSGGRHLVAFLGGTIGNLDPGERKEFLAELVSHMAPGDGLLLGTDLIKDPGRLVAAYDDAEGVTASFNLNVLRVINRELHADFDPDRFAHRAHWNTAEHRIEMYLDSLVDQRVTVRDLGLEVEFAAGEAMLTEISTKFDRAELSEELSRAGLRLEHFWTDDAGDFALSLSVMT